MLDCDEARHCPDDYVCLLKLGPGCPGMVLLARTCVCEVSEGFQRGFARRLRLPFKASSWLSCDGALLVSERFQKGFRGASEAFQRGFRGVSNLSGFRRIPESCPTGARPVWWFQRGFKGVSRPTRGVSDRFQTGFRGVSDPPRPVQMGSRPSAVRPTVSLCNHPNKAFPSGIGGKMVHLYQGKVQRRVQEKGSKAGA